MTQGFISARRRRHMNPCGGGGDSGAGGWPNRVSRRACGGPDTHIAGVSVHVAGVLERMLEAASSAQVAPAALPMAAHPPHAHHARPGGVLVVLALAAHYGRVGIDRGRGAVAGARHERHGRAGQSVVGQHGEMRHQRRPDGPHQCGAHHVPAAVVPRRALAGGRHDIASGHAWRVREVARLAAMAVTFLVMPTLDRAQQVRPGRRLERRHAR
mmetsp:Transcript_1546/g.3841  ORF Transcript_1546/g.3841 Transcript_1546/m.3841 type:complete len:213 (+) Transcript_1546:150-788(+)